MYALFVYKSNYHKSVCQGSIPLGHLPKQVDKNFYYNLGITSLTSPSVEFLFGHVTVIER